MNPSLSGCAGAVSAAVLLDSLAMDIDRRGYAYKHSPHFLIMPVKHPFNIYREKFWPSYHGFALWNPNSVEGVYNQVTIGDVGYISEDAFIHDAFLG